MKVYFDLDSVLADFDRGVSELCKMEPLNQTNVSAERDDAMWKAIRDTEHFYDRLELMPGAKEMFDFAYGLLDDDCQILSGIPKAKRGIVTAGEDKISWSHRMLNPDVKVNIVYKEQKKEFCTGKDCILVDDLDANIAAWEQCGGTGILHKNSKTSMKRLRELCGLYGEALNNPVVEDLLEQLDEMWNLSDDPRYKGENTGCLELSDEIEEEFKKMSNEEIRFLLNGLPMEQMEQIMLAMEDLVDEYSVFKPYIDRMYAKWKVEFAL